MKKGIGIVAGTLIFNSCVAFAGAATSGVPSLNPSYVPPTTGVQNGALQVLGAVRWIAVVVAIAMIIWIGIKYLTAGAGQKAEVKSTMIPLLIGAALVALAPQIAYWVFNMFSGGE